MNRYFIQFSGGVFLDFTGRLIARVSSPNDEVSFSIYAERSGRIVCHKNKKQNTPEVAVCANLNEVFDFFGSGLLAKDLYEKANIAVFHF